MAHSTFQKARAIQELSKTNRNYATALSGKNPPFDPPPPKPYPIADVVLFGVILPGIVAVFFFELLIYFWDHHGHGNPLGNESSAPAFIGAVILFFIGAGFIGHAHTVHSRPRTSGPRQSPIPMQLLDYDFGCDVHDNQISLRLEYEIPASTKNQTFNDLIGSHYLRVVSQFTDTKLKEYVQGCEQRGKKPSFDDYAEALAPEEIEAELVPFFGQAVFESSISVFRFTVVKMVSLSSNSEMRVRTRGFIGTTK